MVLRNMKFTDAAEGLWREEQVKHVMSRLYEFEYPAYRHRELFPTDFEADPASDVVSYEVVDRVGNFKIISGSARDLPRIDAYIKEFKFPVKLFAGEYEITNEEFRKARATGRDVQSIRARATREAHLKSENDIVWYGSERHGIEGILNNPKTIEVILPADGASNKRSWADKLNTPQLILRDLSMVANASPVATNEVERPNTLIIASRQWRIIKDLAYGDNADRTVLEYFQRTNENITAVVPLPELNGAGTDGSDLALCYTRSPDKLLLSIPMELLPSTPYPDGLSIVVPNEAKTAGIILIRPLSVAYARLSEPNAGQTLDVTPDSIRSARSNSSTDIARGG